MLGSAKQNKNKQAPAYFPLHTFAPRIFACVGTMFCGICGRGAPLAFILCCCS